MSKFQVRTRNTERDTAIFVYFERLGRPSLYTINYRGYTLHKHILIPRTRKSDAGLPLRVAGKHSIRSGVVLASSLLIQHAIGADREHFPMWRLRLILE